MREIESVHRIQESKGWSQLETEHCCTGKTVYTPLDQIIFVFISPLHFDLNVNVSGYSIFQTVSVQPSILCCTPPSSAVYCTVLYLSQSAMSDVKGHAGTDRKEAGRAKSTILTWVWPMCTCLPVMQHCTASGTVQRSVAGTRGDRTAGTGVTFYSMTWHIFTINFI